MAKNSMSSPRQGAARLLSNLGNGAMSPSAYDTAWVARVPLPGDPSQPAFPQALEWLRMVQNSDGSWGTPVPYYYDRAVNTLAALIALAQWKQGGDQDRLEYAHHFLASMSPPDDKVLDTTGFELIFPSLLWEATRLNYSLPQSQFQNVLNLREEKLRKLPLELIYCREATPVFSLEFLGENLDVQRAYELQESNGSICNSPAATAFFATKTGDQRAYEYLNTVTTNGCTPFAMPVDIFERAWVLYNLDMAGLLNLPEARPHIQYLREAWTSTGVSFSRLLTLKDLDDTAVAFKLLHHAGIRVDLSVFAGYLSKSGQWFESYPFERNPSVSVNLHVMDALMSCDNTEETEEWISWVLTFVRQYKRGPLWYDKWHTSPHYTTAHAIIIAGARAPDLIADSVQWILKTQREDGSWGWWCPTAEETAYCLQALSTCHHRGWKINRSVMARAATYLWQHLDEDYVPLWIGKVAFTPHHIVRSAIVSALHMYEEKVS
jgi:halimadienyl-diphosphate synthase